MCTFCGQRSFLDLHVVKLFSPVLWLLLISCIRGLILQNFCKVVIVLEL